MMNWIESADHNASHHIEALDCSTELVKLQKNTHWVHRSIVTQTRLPMIHWQENNHDKNNALKLISLMTLSCEDWIEFKVIEVIAKATVEWVIEWYEKQSWTLMTVLNGIGHASHGQISVTNSIPNGQLPNSRESALKTCQLLKKSSSVGVEARYFIPDVVTAQWWPILTLTKHNLSLAPPWWVVSNKQLTSSPDQQHSTPHESLPCPNAARGSVCQSTNDQVLIKGSSPIVNLAMDLGFTMRSSCKSFSSKKRFVLQLCAGVTVGITCSICTWHC